MKKAWIAAFVLAAIVAGTATAANAPTRLNRVTATRKDDFLRLRINLNRHWKSGLLAKGTGISLTVFYETTGDRRTDYVGRITYHDGELFEKITGRDSDFPEVLVTRPSATEARFQHPSDVFFPEPEVPGTMRLIVVLKQPGYSADRLPRKGWWPIPRPE